jgi:hypothetical protein
MVGIMGYFDALRSDRHVTPIRLAQPVTRAAFRVQDLAGFESEGENSGMQLTYPAALCCILPFSIPLVGMKGACVG